MVAPGPAPPGSGRCVGWQLDDATPARPDRRSSRPTARLTIDPASGGRMTSLVVAGSELLVTEGLGPFAWGCYPMAPFAGRIRDGRFTFDGRTSPCHWRYRRTPSTARSSSEAGPWMASCMAPATARRRSRSTWARTGRSPAASIQRLVLGSGGLQARTARGRPSRCPVSMGWHPWFRRRLTGSADAPAPPSRSVGAGLRPRVDVRARCRQDADRAPRRADPRPVGRLLHRRSDTAPPRLAGSVRPRGRRRRAITGWCTRSPTMRSASNRRPDRPVRSSASRRWCCPANRWSPP